MLQPQEQSGTGGSQGETEHSGQSSQGSSINSYGNGGQFNAPGGTMNKSTGSGNHFTGAKFSGPVYFGTKEHFDPLRDCLRSLAFPEMDSRFLGIDAAAKGTCKWLLLHETYKSWTSCNRGLLWIKGNPGSGKSTLLRYILDYVMGIPNTGEEDLTISFFFHGRGSELQKTPFGLFRSLLHQLLRQAPEALTHLTATFQQRCESIGKPGEKWQWHPFELQRFFELSFRKVLEARTVWLFVDALDECGKENAVNLAEEFKSLLTRLTSSGLKQAHICFACRHYPIIDLDCVFEICVEKENRMDISTYVQDKLSSFHGPTSSRIYDLVTNRANGVFMWAWLVMKQVLDLEREGAGLKETEAVILSVPRELDALYHELIQSMGPDSLKLIEWICFATRPLSLDELRWAMLVDADCPHRSLDQCQNAGNYPSDNDGIKRRVQSLSCGLAEVTSDTNVAQFIHQSVKDFFVEKGLSALNETTNPNMVVGIAHHRLSRTCIHYLTMDEVGRSAGQEPDRLKFEFPFLHYATTSWVVHMKQSDTKGIPQEALLEYFTGPLNPLMERWVRIYRMLDRFSYNCPPKGASLVHIISMYGVAGVLQAILERADQVDIDIDGKDPITETVRTILKYTFRIGINAEDGEGRTPLWWSAENGHEAIVRLLLDRGAHIEAADDYGETPLLRVAENGHEAIVRLLLDRGAHIEAVNAIGWTPLLRATENGHEAIVRLLLDRGAHIEAADAYGETPLLRAAENGHEAIVRLLLKWGAHTEAVNAIGWTPLLRATENGHEAIVRLLLDRGAHIEAADAYGETPLLRAAENGHEAIVRLLLKRGAHSKAVNAIGWTPWFRLLEK